MALSAPAVSLTAAARALPRRAGSAAGALPRRAARALGPAGFTLAMVAYFGVAFALEPYGGRVGELAIGMVTWLVLIAAVRPLPPRERARVAGVVLVATGGEILGSLILGLYEYRRGGIPAFVPPGHGLVYLAGYRLTQSAIVQRNARAVVRLAIAGGAAWGVLAVALARRPDVAGALAMVAMLVFLLRGREPVLFASMLLVVAALELYGTRMGTWEWAAHWPVTGIPAGNPPSGIASGYCLFDVLALALAPRLERLAGWAVPAAIRLTPGNSSPSAVA